jgi:neurotransmitter:Na+ symporter, NSS family
MAVARESWSGRAGFILATVGSAVGLGSIWKFPYEVGANGGGAFVVFYVIGVGLIVTPLMLAEFAIGRRGRSDAISSIAAVAEHNGASRLWAAFGLLGVITAFLIVTYYSVIGGWTIAYAVEAAVTGLPGTDPRTVQARFDGLLASPITMALAHALFMAATGIIVARGIAGGIEAACKVLMPVLIALLVVLTVYSVVQGDVSATLRFLFALDPARITAKAALDALGLGFFSIGVGMAVMITYAAYAGKGIDLREVAIATIIGDTAISFIAGFAVFPIVFANALDPASGPGLLFVTLPLAFARMPAGGVAGVAFYLLLLAAALASAMSMLEMAVAPLRRALGWSRARTTGIVAIAAWVLGLGTVLSFNAWSEWHPLWFLPGLGEATWFEVIDHLTSNVMLPVGGFALAIFAGWILPGHVLQRELQLGRRMLTLLRILLRYVVGPAIAAVALLPYFA